jgi:ATP-dependent RNA helicase DDX46/PRP5
MKLDDMPAIDMSMDNGVVASVGDLEGDEDEDEANKMDVELRSKAKTGKEDAKMEVDEDEDVDPLDAFMSEVKQEVTKVNADDMKRGILPARSRIRLDDPNGEPGMDEIEPEVNPDEIDTTELNPEDILALAAKRAKKKDIALVDHSKVTYEPFRKEFYVAPPDIAEMTEDDVELIRLELDGIKIRGVDCPRPVTKWSHFGMPASAYVSFFCLLLSKIQRVFSSLDVIKKLNFTAPTPIQAQAIPAIMSGRDCISVAKTGSGKTIAFLIPMFRHIKDQRPLETMEGPVAVIMTPTRELAVQIHRECKPFLRVLNLRVSLMTL